MARLGRYEVDEASPVDDPAARLRARRTDDPPGTYAYRITQHRRPPGDEDPWESLRRDELLAEARWVSKAQGPHLAALEEVLDLPTGLYFVLHTPPGLDLPTLLHVGETLPWRDRVGMALRVMLDALAGASALHAVTDATGQPLGLLLRYVTPADIHVDGAGVGRLAEPTRAMTPGRVAATSPVEVAGQHRHATYLSPEQGIGAVVDLRSDLFALATILGEALTGQPLWTGATPLEALLGLRRAPGPGLRNALPELPAAIEAVCLRALARDAGARYGSAAELAEALRAAAASHDLLASREAVAARCQRCMALSDPPR